MENAKSADTAVINALRATPHVQAALEKNRRRIVSEREADLAAMVAAEKEASTARERLDGEIAEAKRALEAARRAFSDADQNLARLVNARFVLGYRLDITIAEHRGRLIAGAPPEIAAFEAELRTLLEDLRGAGVVTNGATVYDKAAKTWRPTIEGNWTALKAASDAVRSVLAKLDELRLLPDPEKALTRVAELRAELPVVEEVAAVRETRWAAPLPPAGRDGRPAARIVEAK